MIVYSSIYGAVVVAVSVGLSGGIGVNDSVGVGGMSVSVGTTMFVGISVGASVGGNVTELTSGTRYKHFCLEVTGLDEFCRELKNRGVSVSDISMGMDNSRQAWISDPDGNQIELMEYGHASLQLTGKLTA